MGFPLPEAGAVTEDTGLVGGFLTVSGDADYGPFFNNDAGEWTAQTISGLYGSSLTIDADGAWTYVADNSDASIQALNTGETLTEVFTISSGNGNTTVTITINGLDEPPCFVTGTLIETPQGPRPVESLAIGDEVLTRDNGVQTIRWAGARTVQIGSAEAKALQPIRLRKDSLGKGVPDRDILVSPMHRILVHNPTVELVTGECEVFCPAKSLVNGQSIVQERAAETTYHHLLFDRHEVLLSSGCSSESFYAGPVGLGAFEMEAREEVFELFPELRSQPDHYGRTARRVARSYELKIISDALKPQDRLLESLRAAVA